MSHTHFYLNGIDDSRFRQPDMLVPVHRSKIKCPCFQGHVIPALSSTVTPAFAYRTLPVRVSQHQETSRRQSTRGPQQLYESQRIRTTSQNDFGPGQLQPCHYQFRYNPPVITTEPPQHVSYQVQNQEESQCFKLHQSLFESVSSDGTTIQQCPSPVAFSFHDISDSSSQECFRHFIPDTEQGSSDETTLSEF
jgi:hypothetical protein